MRTKTDLDTALLTSPASARATYIKVEIDADGSGTWVDLSDFSGDDFVRGVSYTEQLGTPAWSAQVQLSMWLRDRPGYSLSPFQAASLLNADGVLVQPYRKIRISTATVPIGDPRPSTFNEVFLGRIDSYTMNGTEVTLSCRDQTGDLMDRFVEVEKKYGSDNPAIATNNELNDIIQDIVDDHYNTASDIGGSAGSPYTLYSENGTSGTPWSSPGDDSGWSIRRFIATKSPVWQWIETLAQMIGWSLRFRWHEGSGIDAFVLVLEEPDRSSPSSSLTLDPTLGQCTIGNVGLSIQDVRNFWRVGYAVNGDESASVTATNAASATKYGRRYAEMVEGSASQIDTSTEAQALANNNLVDTKEPTATVALQLPYLWYPQLNDIVTVAADNVYFDSDQALCLIGRQNRIVQGGPAMTSMTLHGTLQTTAPRRPQRQYARKRHNEARRALMATAKGNMAPNPNFADIENE